MREPLSAAASINAVGQLATKIIGYISTAAGVKQEKKRLWDEIRTCENVLQDLRDRDVPSDEDTAWSETIKVLEGLGRR